MTIVPRGRVWRWRVGCRRVGLRFEAGDGRSLVLGRPESSRTWAQAPKEVGSVVGSVIKKRRKRMAKKKHRKLLKRTRVQRRNKK